MPGETARDPRQTTFLKVHIRYDSGWSEAIVCNVSAHGMMLRGGGLPGRGEFIEIASGPIALAGQVRWSLAGRCGIRTREVIDLAALLGDQPLTRSDSAPAARYTTGPRSRPPADARAMGRAIDFTLTLALLAGGAWFIGSYVDGLLGKPMAQISTGLAAA